jgi:hypothetical protein
MLLVSFCSPVSPDRQLALVDFDSEVVQWLPGLPPGASAMGLLTLEDGWLSVYTNDTSTGPDSGVVRFNHQFQAVERYPFQTIRQAHSLRPHGAGFAVNSSGTDSLVHIELLPDGQVREDLLWRLGDGGHECHVNSLHITCETVLVTMFGPRKDSGWFASASGCVWDVGRNAPVCEGLVHPHTLFTLDGATWVLESFSGRVLELCEGAPVERFRIPGYARGAVAVGEWLYVGSSFVRLRSKHLGVRRPRPPKLRSRCAIYRIHLPTGKMDVRDLSRISREVYDIVWLGDAKVCPVGQADASGTC